MPPPHAGERAVLPPRSVPRMLIQRRTRTLALACLLAATATLAASGCSKSKTPDDAGGDSRLPPCPCPCPARRSTIPPAGWQWILTVDQLTVVVE